VGDVSSSAVQSQTIQSSQTPTLTPAALEQASKYAIQVGKEISSYSKLADNRDEIPLLEREEVVLGDLLGTGGFNNVYEVHAIELLDDESDNSQNQTSGGQQKSKQKPHSELTSTPSQISARRALAKLGGGSLAVKFLNESCKVSSQEYANGAADLVLETRYLSALSSYPHPNIIRLHGVAAAGPEGFATGAEGAYFLVLDRLSDTLDGRIEVWKELERRKKANLNPEFELHLKALYAKQIQVGVDLASALAHLHKLRIIFRDLKVRDVFVYKDENHLWKDCCDTDSRNSTPFTSLLFQLSTARKYRIRCQGCTESVRFWIGQGIGQSTKECNGVVRNEWWHG
jgi:hypothetical protein